MNDRLLPGKVQPLPDAPAARTASGVPESWELVLAAAWKDAAVWAYACIAVAVTIWELQHRSLLVPFVMDVDNPAIGAAQSEGRAALLRHVYVALPFALVMAATVLIRRRRGLPRFPTAWAPLVIALPGLPVLGVHFFEYRYPLFTGIIVAFLAFGTGRLAYSLARARGLASFDISARSALIVVGAGWIVFTAVIGFMAHLRFITFHPQPYDMSCETNAIHNLVHSGIPRISVCFHDWFPGQKLGSSREVGMRFHAARLEG